MRRVRLGTKGSQLGTRIFSFFLLRQDGQTTGHKRRVKTGDLPTINYGIHRGWRDRIHAVVPSAPRALPVLLSAATPAAPPRPMRGAPRRLPTALRAAPGRAAPPSLAP